MAENDLYTRNIGLKEINEAAAFIRNVFKIKADEAVAPLAIILGSGLGTIADKLMESSKSFAIDYSAIPHFPTSSIEGHNSRLVLTSVNKEPILLMQGRVHRYEGYSPAQVAFPIRVLNGLGVKTLIITNAAGAIGDHLNVGDLMLITDHINMTGDNPLIGPNDLRLGPRFFDMSETYTKLLRKTAKEIATQNKIELKEGIYIGVLGPCYETPAEIQMFKTMGADAVGMSTVFEAIAAKHSGMQILGISCMTNKAAGLSTTPLNHEEVTEIGLKAASRFSTLLLGLINKLFTTQEK